MNHPNPALIGTLEVTAWTGASAAAASECQEHTQWLVFATCVITMTYRVWRDLRRRDSNGGDSDRP